MKTKTICATVDGQSVEAAEGTLLSELLPPGHSPDLPCAGQGKCGKCRVIARGYLSPLAEEERRHLTIEELDGGVRLACRCRAEGDCSVELPARTAAQIRGDGVLPDFPWDPLFTSYGVAVDIGTTTLAAHLYGRAGLLAQRTAPNPQGRYGADVISRVGQAMDGKGEELARCIREAVAALLLGLCADAGVEPAQVDALVITGNTAMLYLLTLTPPGCLSHAPFEADRLFGEFVLGADLDLPCSGARVYLPRCISAFVGADITTALLSSGICARTGPALLADVGTNGEMALWRGGALHCCSTAAGPAFEGAGLSMGMPGCGGAVDHVELRDGILTAHVIGEEPPVGICGSGILDALACLLQSGILDESGTLEAAPAVIAGPVVVTQRDVRMVQLAKSAVCAGLRTLLQSSGVSPDEVVELAVAGGFGSYLDLNNAGLIGLIPPELTGKARVLGNAALTGAAMLLLNREFLAVSEDLARGAETVDLASSAVFQELYVEGMFF